METVPSQPQKRVKLHTPHGHIDLESLPEYLTQEKVDEIIEAADQIAADTITAQTLPRYLSHLQKCIEVNSEQRLKHPDDPEKFMKSEVDLDEQILRLQTIAADKNLVQGLLTESGLQILIPLCCHPNIDISGSLLSAMTELTTPDTFLELTNPDECLRQFIDLKMLKLVTDLIIRAPDEAEDPKGLISDAYQVIDNLLELSPIEVSDNIAETSANLLEHLLTMIRTEDVKSQLELYAVELLSILLQSSDLVKTFVGDKADGISKLIRCIAPYRKRAPADLEEEEYLENLGHCLASLLQFQPRYRLLFTKLHGLDLMIRFIKDRLSTYLMALKLLALALENTPENCQAFVSKCGLKSLFGLFMKYGSLSKPNTPQNQQEDEYCITILHHLIQHTSRVQQARVLNKFTEYECQKVEHLLELHQFYFHQFNERTSKRQQQRSVAQELHAELHISQTDDQDYLDKCEDGLFIVQMIDLILVRLVNLGNEMLQQRIYHLMRMKGIPANELVVICEDYCKRLNATTTETSDLLNLVAFFRELSALHSQA